MKFTWNMPDNTLMISMSNLRFLTLERRDKCLKRPPYGKLMRTIATVFIKTIYKVSHESMEPPSIAVDRNKTLLRGVTMSKTSWIPRPRRNLINALYSKYFVGSLHDLPVCGKYLCHHVHLHLPTDRPMSLPDQITREPDSRSWSRLSWFYRLWYAQAGSHFSFADASHFFLPSCWRSRYDLLRAVTCCWFAFTTRLITVFGLATLIFNGLEIAMHATLEGKCVAEIVFAHPILQALFTFLQMHFLFVNSEVRWTWPKHKLSRDYTVPS